MGKTRRREMDREEAFTSLGEAMGVTELQPVSGLQTYSASTAEVSEAEVQEALKAAYSANGYLGLRSRAADTEFAAILGLELRKDSKGRALALQSEDLPKGADERLTVTVSGRDGNPLEVRLGGCIRHNRALGLAVAAGKALTSVRKNNPAVVTQAKLLGMELSNIKATAEEKRSAFDAFYIPHTVRVELRSAKEFLAAAEPKVVKSVSRRVMLRKELSGDALSRVDSILAQLKAVRK